MRYTGAQRMMRDVPDGMAIDFTDMSMVVRDSVTAINNFDGDANNKLTYTAPSTKYVRDHMGIYRAGTTFRASYDDWSLGVNAGLLIEEARTNLLLRSMEFDNASWTKSNVTVTADSAAGFDGSTSADTLTATGANGYVVQNGAANATNAGRMGSVFLRRKTGTGTVTLEVGQIATTCALDANQLIRFEARGVGLAGTYVLATNVITVTATAHGLVTGDAIRADITSGAAVDASVASVTVADANTFTYAQVAADTSGNVTVYANCLRVKLATSGDEVYASQAQLEIRAVTGNDFGSSPIVTTSATVTRAVDNITLALSLLPFSATVGSLYCRFSARNSNATARNAMSLDDGTSNEIIEMRMTSAGLMNIVDGGVSQGTPSTNGVSINAFDRSAMRWALNDFAIANNGDSTPGTDTSGTLPTMTTMCFASRTSGSQGNLTGHISHLFYVPRLMDNTELIWRTMIPNPATWP